MGCSYMNVILELTDAIVLAVSRTYLKSFWFQSYSGQLSIIYAFSIVVLNVVVLLFVSLLSTSFGSNLKQSPRFFLTFSPFHSSMAMNPAHQTAFLP